MTNSAILQPPSKSLSKTVWTLQIILACIYLAAATAKLAGVPMMVDVFRQIGLGQWFRYVTAAVEITGAIALLFPRFSVAGAVLLATTMAFAVVAHVAILHTNPAPPIVLGLMDVALIWLRRDQLAELLAGLRNLLLAGSS